MLMHPTALYSARPAFLFLAALEGSSGGDSTVTFSNVSLGSPASGRRILIGGFQAGATPTINGTSATVISSGASILELATGTSATFVFNTGTNTDVAVGVFALYGLSSDTPLDTDTSSANPATATLTAQDNGFGLAVCSSAGENNVTGSWNSGDLLNNSGSGIFYAVTYTYPTSAGGYAPSCVTNTVFDSNSARFITFPALSAP